MSTEKDTPEPLPEGTSPGLRKKVDNVRETMGVLLGGFSCPCPLTCYSL